MTQNKTKWSVHLQVMEVQGYIRDIHTKKVETHMCDIHSKILKTFRIFVWHSHKEKRDSYTQKDAKRYDSPHNMGNVCEIKRNKKKWKSIVWQLHKIKWDSSTGNWRICVAVHTWKKSETFTQKNHSPIWYRQSTTFVIVTNKHKWNSSINKTELSKGQTGN